METAAHLRLKRMALAFLRQRGCLAAAQEVRCPIGRFIIDVAGYQDRQPKPPGQPRPFERVPPRTIVIECKQCRADFLRDDRQVEKLLCKRDDLLALRRSIEEHQVKAFEPQLRLNGSSLFQELEEWDFSASRLPSYRSVMTKLRRVEKSLHGQTKFCLIAQYRLADEMYIAAPRGMVKPRELPIGWGLLEVSADWLEAVDGAQLPPQVERPMLTITVPSPPQHSAAEKHRMRLLRNIAVAASFAARPPRVV